jgi:hypothetical protein
MNKFFLFLAFFFNLTLAAQVNFSIETGLSGLHNFSPQQSFWAIGQTVEADFHFSPRHTAYASLDYYTEGKFKNDFVAVAKPPFTGPLRINYTATGRLTYRQISLGWKHYFKGSFNEEKNFNIYSMAGFGFLLGRVRNNFSVSIDTGLYRVEPTLGENKFRRLTFDIGVGAEQPLGGNFFLFAHSRLWLPASSHTSPYLSNQRDVPLAVMVSAGLRILFGTNY